MDARRRRARGFAFLARSFRTVAAGALAAVLAGCQGMFPAARPAATDAQPRPEDEPLVVNAASQPASRPADDLDAALAEKIESWAARVQRADASRSRGEPSLAVDFSAGAPPREPRAAASRPARDPREITVEFAPEKPVAAAPAGGDVTVKSTAAPPVLRNVWPAAPAGRTEAAPRPTAGSVGLNDPATAVASGPASLADALEEMIASSPDTGFREQMDRRIAAVLLGDYARARQPFEIVADEQNELGQRLIETLIAIRDQGGGDPAGESTDALRRINELRHSLRSVSDLGLATVAICRAVRGFGQYEAFEPAQFTAGRASEFVLYCELRDFASAEQPDGSFESRFSLKVAILSHSGDEVSSLAADDIVDRCRARRNDCFLSPVIRLPATLSPGEYSARVTVEDKIKKRVVERIATFRLVSKG